MPRLLLCDEHWSKLRQILLQLNIYDKHTLRQAHSTHDCRSDVLSDAYRMSLARPPLEVSLVNNTFGCWNSIYKRFNAWSASGKWLKIFKALMIEPDLEWAFILTGVILKPTNTALELRVTKTTGLEKGR